MYATVCACACVCTRAHLFVDLCVTWVAYAYVFLGKCMRICTHMFAYASLRVCNANRSECVRSQWAMRLTAVFVHGYVQSINMYMYVCTRIYTFLYVYLRVYAFVCL